MLRANHSSRDRSAAGKLRRIGAGSTRKTNSRTSRAAAGPVRSGGPRLIAREKNPRRACDHLGNALRRKRRRRLKNKRQKQRRLAHLHELRRRELAIVDRKILCLDMRLEIERKAADGFLQHMLVIAAASVRDPRGHRHHRAARRSGAPPPPPPDLILTKI